MRGDRKKCEQKAQPRASSGMEVIDISEYRPRKMPSPLWRECIKKIWEVDPLCCPRCRTEMKIVSFITQTDVIKKILVHLELWEEFTKRRPPPVLNQAKKVPAARPIQLEPVEDGWPGYEEPWVDIHSL